MNLLRLLQPKSSTASACAPTVGQQLARNASGTDVVVFYKVAMVCMGAMAAASVMGVLQPLLRSIKERKRKRLHNDRGPEQ